jgi:hypothetical protein
MAETFIWQSEHEFYFDSKGPITAVSLADNLLGLDGIAQFGTKILENLLDVKINDSDVLIQSVSLQSYKDTFWFRLIFGAGKKGEQKLEKFREALKLRDMDARTLAQFALAGAVLWGAYKLSDSWKTSETDPSRKDALVHFENSFNNMSLKVGLTPEEAMAIFEKAIKKEEGLKKDVIRLARPAGQALSGTITFDGEPAFSVPAEVIEVLPEKYTKPEPEEPEDEFESIDIVVRALDLDRPETGWWAIIPEMTEKRLPVSLDDEVKPSTLPAGKLFKAHVTVIYSMDRHGEKVPKRVLLHKKL